jgi:hypothetical protein
MYILVSYLSTYYALAICHSRNPVLVPFFSDFSVILTVEVTPLLEFYMYTTLISDRFGRS